MLRGSITKGAGQIALYTKNSGSKKSLNAKEKQAKTLKKLIEKSKGTEFGKKYHFNELLKSENLIEEYRKNVPIFQYDFMYKKFWHKTFAGVENVSWPGRIKNFALTSGTTNSSSKKIPVSKQMIKSIRRSCLNQLISLSHLNLGSDFYEKEVLVLGGSTDLQKVSNQQQGDLSGILTGKVPHWLNPYTKPNKTVRAINDWDQKLNLMVDEAPKWDIGIICGVPCWIQLLIEKIMDRYQLKSIFEIWPNLKFYIHGGVSISPYLQKLNTIFQERVIYLDTYLASEGFIGYQKSTDSEMSLCLGNGIYFEFIPFNLSHFDSEGNLCDFTNALTIDEIEEGKEYALLLTTNSGAFRYLIGDTIRITDIKTLQFKITGRTKHFLSLCGEHLSVDNMTEAISQLAYEKNISIDEFAVIGKSMPDGTFTHKWFLASNSDINTYTLKHELDEKLGAINDDYKAQRLFNLNPIEVELLPPSIFYNFLKIMDKYGSQHKFPRVLKGKLAADWEHYLDILAEENIRT